MDSVLPVLHSIIPPRFDCIDCHQHFLGLAGWLPGRLNQSGTIWRSAHILVLWAFRILNAIVLLYFRFSVCCAIVFAVTWIIKVAIPVKPSFSIRYGFWGAMLIMFDWMTIDSRHSANTQCLSRYTTVDLCRRSCSQRTIFSRFKRSCIIKLQKWPGCCEDYSVSELYFKWTSACFEREIPSG